MLRCIAFCAALLVGSVSAACASPHHAPSRACTETGDIMRPVCGTVSGGFLAGVRSIRVTMHRERRASADVPAQVVGGRPAGCPHAFCGCGASLYLFGRIVPGLNLAANWLRFPRAAPAPRMAAARPGHVFVLERQIAGDVWLVYDANSGGHVTRIHARSLRGYTIVDPHGAA